MYFIQDNSFSVTWIISFYISILYLQLRNFNFSIFSTRQYKVFWNQCLYWETWKAECHYLSVLSTLTYHFWEKRDAITYLFWLLIYVWLYFWLLKSQLLEKKITLLCFTTDSQNTYPLFLCLQKCYQYCFNTADGDQNPSNRLVPKVIWWVL